MKKKLIFRAKLLGSHATRDGDYKIVLYLYKEGRQKIIDTGMRVPSKGCFCDGRFVREKDSKKKNEILQGMMDRMMEKIKSLEGIEMYTAGQIRDMIDVPETRVIPTFRSVSEQYISELLSDGRASYASLLERNTRHFMEFSGGDVALADITPQYIAGFGRFMAGKKIGDSYLGMVLSRVRTIINRAIRIGMVKYDVHPFAMTRIPQPESREIDLDIDNFIRLMRFDATSRRTKLAKDMFMLSFYLGGMNLADILSVSFGCGDRLEYERRKTGGRKAGVKSTVIPLIPQARNIIERYSNEAGMIETGYSLSYGNTYRYITRALHEIEQCAGITQHVVFYSARKTFAQFASDLCIPEHVIDYCLGHSDKSRGVMRYYTKVKLRQAEIAICKVAEYVEHPERFNDYIEMRRNIMTGLM